MSPFKIDVGKPSKIAYSFFVCKQIIYHVFIALMIWLILSHFNPFRLFKHFYLIYVLTLPSIVFSGVLRLYHISIHHAWPPKLSYFNYSATSFVDINTTPCLTILNQLVKKLICILLKPGLYKIFIFVECRF